ncbi:proline--tRNA ligase [Candidatus Finniella inopinata]|uniref:Proline--tRNA ligase n=1 Tax=Candidatus Finniella inopinata TaxID=1696036 RepID=A0A4V2DZP7_9PROT|nr:proline--tRNA ligase [Candidatus Finniella inopinata]RZI45797.1 proline--tRNA ligase [Candidatus Finniella inopinata]
MRLSQYFLPTLKETPSEAQIASHRLMLRAGMINQTTSGIYTWLPLGLKVLQKIENIVAEEQNRIGCHRVLMPTLQPASLWQESGRYEAYGKEMLRFKDRHDREMLYSPTNEEVITDIVRQYVKSYRALPQILYQIGWKFRDEIRPRFGVMRGREFFMKDGYSFDIDYEGAKASYEKIFQSYLTTFRRLGLTAIPVQADSGAIGGNLSHEFQIVAPTGESTIYYDEDYDQLSDQDMTLERLRNMYAAADEKHDPFQCPIPQERLKTARGIEVGHIFYFGTKYSKAMNLTVQGPKGELIIPEMGSYGIGVSRLVGAIIEASHDDNGIIWPDSVTPFHVGLISAKADDAQVEAAATALYQQLATRGFDVLYDDRSERIGVKFADMDLIGLPWQIVVGNKTIEHNTVELKNRRTGERQDLSIEACLTYLQKHIDV